MADEAYRFKFPLPDMSAPVGIGSIYYFTIAKSHEEALARVADSAQNAHDLELVATGSDVKAYVLKRGLG